MTSSSPSPSANTNTRSSPQSQQLWIPQPSHHQLELFSVAPMMAHTNRHYRFFFRQLSQYAHIYTEMMPSAQIVQVFELAVRAITSSTSTTTTISSSSTSSEMMIPYDDPEAMQELAHRIYQCQQQTPSVLYSEENAGYFAGRNLLHYSILQEIMAPYNNNNNNNINNNEYHTDPIVLQLGGRNPETLGKATAIAMAFGYTQINLNCGCPSANVAKGNQAGAALMLEPTLVAECLEQMSQAMIHYQHQHQTNDDDDNYQQVQLSLKHRLGVAFANEYDADWDHAQTDEAAYQTCHDFLKVMESGSNILSKVQVHARLALLGIGDTNNLYTTNGDGGGDGIDDDDDDDDAIEGAVVGSQGDREPETNKKINHKRAQYFAKREARQATIQNRSVPPLRPKVVEQIARDFGSKWEVVSNGGIQSMSDVADRLQRPKGGNPAGDQQQQPQQQQQQVDNLLWQGQAVTGAMVGRAAINHPCSFATVDSVLWGASNKPKKTRFEILQTYMEYCQEQEDRLKTIFPSTTPTQWKHIRKQLVAVPFHLFMGEEGNNAYQRRLRKLSGRGERYSAKGMLDAAAREVPSETLEKSVEEHTPWADIEKFDFTKRSGSMHRTIY
ncbi:unnamed protein product [Cylindrotheca closterium]|uniref:DUS-like FMN-binding domain-containing protein n=1 Tax=Cylindrotheca closterium TaxID=2856 RepID=A0AAD2FLY5_9STRA|nr:unnamed protein product [Cylindrotheca closterium]